ncbi:GPI mannosyltransferase 2-like [Watersipora subatra]|uniref:GPI mannosyltransferase 2-like n=1 Tax=Watersipora subatra TaxID=2589382 RepID=UPI00355B078B
MIERETQNIIKYSLLSRIVLFILQVVFNNLIHDHISSDAFDPPAVTNKTGLADDLIEFTLSGFRRWDAIYMLHIAEHGYIYEHTMAFFPAFPFTVRVVGFTFLYPLKYIMSVRHIMMFAAFSLNTVCFVLAASYIYSLASILSEKGKREAWICTVFFCFNPASVFMSAAYTECTFALFSFALMYYIELKQYMKATIALALACATRSNGLVLAGYPFYHTIRLIVLGLQQTKGSYLNLIRDLLKLASCCLYGVAPFVIYQYMGYVAYCRPSKITVERKLAQFGRKNNFHMPGDSPSEWCYYNIPFSYSYIQRKYWNVGFFSYYEWKQLPNFFLALPVVLLSLYCICTCFCNLLRAVNLSHCKFNPRTWLASHSSRTLPYAVHLAFLLFYGLANTHVQILTRMIYSSSPLVYLCVARVIPPVRSWQQLPYLAKCNLIYSLSYFLIGTALHCNFLPWT